MIEQASPIEKTVLGNGLTIITEQMSHVRSASIGIWVRSGSRHEPAELNGISHFIEHTLFKGTRNRTSREIAVESDAIGGHVDAFTSREVASYYVKVLDQHMSRAFDLLADLVTAPLFANDELDRERNVVLEEIKMVEDTPDDLVHEVFVSNFWPDHPLGRSILGTAGTLSTFDHDRVVDFFTNVYTPRNLVVAAAGNVDHKSFVEMVAALPRRFDGTAPRGVPSRVPRPASRRIILNKDLEQAHLVLGDALPFDGFRRPLRRAPAQRDTGRRDELAAVSDDQGRARIGLCRLLRRQRVHGRGLHVYVRRDLSRTDRWKS